VQNYREKGLVDLDLAIVFDEAQLPELGHKQIHAGSSCTDQFCDRFLRILLSSVSTIAYMERSHSRHSKACLWTNCEGKEYKIIA
jgi:hypothetical protein